ncbi:hypothetical protein JVT61DRAFT_12052 [Boletus reticuloceps]|uniref:Uncharacterized protein n=1 Tax=Boletus reticuloceps TaxID=495285 RepID=A0A8I2YEL8_9AGAM|nr:hypothetical protein JVT61DRAFT_12052 [Boletus reticuloceps]
MQHSTVSHFFSLKAKDKDELDENEDDATFTALDNEDSSIQPNIYPAVPFPGPSRYTQAIDMISQHYALHYELGDDKESEEDVDPDLEVMDGIAHWKEVGDWLCSTLKFDIFTKKLDFQHEKHAKIRYWEDLFSELAFKNNVEK